MLLRIPPVPQIVPGTDYKGFRPYSTYDIRADLVTEVDSEQLFLARPIGLVRNFERHVLMGQGIILSIGVAIALRERPQAIPKSLCDTMYDEPLRILTSTVMISDYDNMLYVAYFYINADGEVVTSFISKSWASEYPSLAIKPA